MIKRSHRFHGQASLKKVYSAGKSVRGGQIALKYLKNSNDKPYRMAVVVSKKVDKSAVKRNKMRRRIYEIVRKSATPPPHGQDMIFTVFSGDVKDMHQDKLNKTINELVKKAK